MNDLPGVSKMYFADEAEVTCRECGGEGRFYEPYDYDRYSGALIEREIRCERCEGGVETVRNVYVGEYADGERIELDEETYEMLKEKFDDPQNETQESSGTPEGTESSA